MPKKRFFKTKDECEVTFELEHQGAAEVELVCSANQWDPVPMRRTKGGVFRTTLRLPVDARAEYRFRVDGQLWVDDPQADAYVANEFGSTNCVIDTARPVE